MLKLFLTVILSILAVSNGFEIQPRIIKGVRNKIGFFPYYVYLEIHGNQKDKVSGCGGTLISDRWVVTAAHCLLSANEVFVHAGALENGKFVEHVIATRENLHIFPFYCKSHVANDIALVKLSRPVRLTSFIHPIKLPNDCGQKLGNVDAIAVGNGKTSLNGQDDNVLLRYALLKVLPQQFCSRSFPFIGNRKSIICAISPFGQSISKGDSGGPLIRRSDNTLIGISSFVKENIRSKKIEMAYPQGFTNIHPYFDWISGKTGLKLPRC